MSVEPGHNLLHYRLIEQIGEGGMGVVWRARDTTLDRDVAIKILPEAVAQDAERLARFEREARVLATLDHPNIATVHGLHRVDTDTGPVHFLAMEMVEGRDLGARIGDGALLRGEALAIASQIAEALAAAHEHGIVHRDLKPANVRITPGGKVKVLDFGLAKIGEAPDGDSALSHSPTLTAQMTQAGVILGTAAYMSPEQARGRPVDKRTDVWAFGCVLLEMLTGRRTFSGDTVTDVIASVVAREPEWERLPADTPRALRLLLRQCLNKDPDERWRDIADARLMLDEIRAGRVEEVPATAAAGDTRREKMLMAAVALLAVAAAALSFLYWRASEDVTAEPLVYAELVLPAGHALDLDPSNPGVVSISPDGRRVAFSVRDPEGRITLWVRDLDQSAARPLPGTENAAYPFWSPDSRSIAFFADTKLKRINPDGGSALTLTDASNGKGGAWNADGTILFAPSHNTPIHRVPDSGGKSEPITRLDEEKREGSHRHPRFLPDGRHFLFAARTGNSAGFQQGSQIYLGSLDSDEVKPIVFSMSQAEYTNGHLLYMQESSLIARPFSSRALEFLGEPRLLTDDVQVMVGAVVGAFSVSSGDTLAYVSGVASAGDSVLSITDPEGEVVWIGEQARYQEVELSPDGTQVAVRITDSRVGTNDLWLIDLTRELSTRLTFDASDDASPVWSPDGKRIAFGSDRTGQSEIYVREVEGTSPERLLFQDDYEKFPNSWSKDGKHLVYAAVDRVGRWDVFRLPLENGEVAGEPVPIQQTEFDEIDPVLSPDGRWLAYGSNESNQFEIYVTNFPEGERKWLVSSEGGLVARWSHDGKHLYYLAQDGTLMDAEIERTGNILAVGKPRALFDSKVTSTSGQTYDVLPDGKGFILDAVLATQETAPLTLVLHWPAVLERR